jgi:hypothetical protein
MARDTSRGALPLATDCHRLRPLGSISAPSSWPLLAGRSPQRHVDAPLAAQSVRVEVNALGDAVEAGHLEVGPSPSKRRGPRLIGPPRPHHSPLVNTPGARSATRQRRIRALRTPGASRRGGHEQRRARSSSVRTAWPIRASHQQAPVRETAILPAGPDAVSCRRQRLQLRQEPLAPRAARRRGPRSSDDGAVPAPHQRQGRALPPDDGARMGLRPQLPLTSTTQLGAATLARPLQPAQAAQLARRSPTDQPRSQRPWVGQLGVRYGGGRACHARRSSQRSALGARSPLPARQWITRASRSWRLASAFGGQVERRLRR